MRETGARQKVAVGKTTPRWLSLTTALRRGPGFSVSAALSIRPVHSIGPALAVSAALLAASGCQSPDVKECRDKYLETHALVAAVDTQDLAAVEATLASVQANLAVCERANLGEETKQLATAKRKLESHQSYLRQRESHKDLTPAELENLVNNGDPECPRGQAYMYKKGGQRIRCVGPQIVSMNRAEASSYFGGRGYKLHETPTGLKAELGSESYNFEYASGQDDGPSQCLTVFSVPGIAWQETASRVTGAKPSRMKEGKPIRVGKLDVPLTVQQDPIQAILRFGACTEGQPLPAKDAPASAQENAE